MFHSILILFIDLINLQLNVLAFLLNQRPIKIKFLLPLSDFGVLSVTTKFIGFSIQFINSSIGDLPIIFHLLLLGSSAKEIITRRTTIRIRRRGCRGIGGNSSTTGRITENSFRSNTGRTPTGDSLTRFVFFGNIINHPFLIFMLQFHITFIIKLLTFRIDRIRHLIKSEICC